MGQHQVDHRSIWPSQLQHGLDNKKLRTRFYYSLGARMLGCSDGMNEPSWSNRYDGFGNLRVKWRKSQAIFLSYGLELLGQIAGGWGQSGPRNRYHNSRQIASIKPPDWYLFDSFGSNVWDRFFIYLISIGSGGWSSSEYDAIHTCNYMYL